MLIGFDGCIARWNILWQMPPRTLDESPVTLDETYERTLRELDDIKDEFAWWLLCDSVAFRPL